MTRVTLIRRNIGIPYDRTVSDSAGPGLQRNVIVGHDGLTVADIVAHEMSKGLRPLLARL